MVPPRRAPGGPRSAPVPAGSASPGAAGDPPADLCPRGHDLPDRTIL